MNYLQGYHHQNTTLRVGFDKAKVKLLEVTEKHKFRAKVEIEQTGILSLSTLMRSRCRCCANKKLQKVPQQYGISKLIGSPGDSAREEQRRENAAHKLS